LHTLTVTYLDGAAETFEGYSYATDSGFLTLWSSGVEEINFPLCNLRSWKLVFK
jgi:hypothetical protein